MKNIFVIGAGRSASSLIQYLLQHAEAEDWQVTIGDMDAGLAKKKAGNHSRVRTITFDMNNTAQREEELSRADLVISMLPASMHYPVAKDCVRLKRHLVTASYVSAEILALDEEAKKAGVMLMNEIGLDPGIDHMSAMQLIDRIKEEGGELISFKSYCGGLIAPESNDNPWQYKFTWNPRNVVLAGQGGPAHYIDGGAYKYIPYNRLFTQIETITVEGQGSFEAYANRDSLAYRQPYGLLDIPTMLRGTLRMPGYSEAWNALVKLGWTEDTYKVLDAEKLTYRQLLEAYLPAGNLFVIQKLVLFLGEQENSEVMKKLLWLGIAEEEKIPLSNASPAQILQELLERKWKLKVNDIDLVVMQHQLTYLQNKVSRRIVSSLVVKGEDQVYTAMAKTVGLPVAIVARLILNGRIKLTGVQIPVMKEVYEPILDELETYGIRFEEKRS